MKVTITLDLEVEDGADSTDLEALCSALFDFLCDDPGDRFPSIKVVLDASYRTTDQ